VRAFPAVRRRDVTALLGLIPPDELVMCTGRSSFVPHARSRRERPSLQRDGDFHGVEDDVYYSPSQASSGPKNRKWAATRKIDEEETGALRQSLTLLAPGGSFADLWQAILGLGELLVSVRLMGLHVVASAWVASLPSWPDAQPTSTIPPNARGDAKGSPWLWVNCENVKCLHRTRRAAHGPNQG
jgi:hypothetical protein